MDTESLERLLTQGTDNALLRYTLGNAYLKAGDLQRALVHLKLAVEHDSAYSAGWKAYAKALAADGREDDAAAAYRRGIAVAEKHGDIQAAKEMRVFLKRLDKR